MTTNTITPEQRLTVLKHLAGGKGLDVVATIARLPRETVLDIASHHGYPDKSKLSWAVDVLTKKLVAAAGPTTQPDEIRVLLDTAKAHESKRIQRAGDRLVDDIARLRQLIRDDEAKHAERRKADAAKAKAREEVARLEQQLAEARAKLRGTQPAAPKTSPGDGSATAAEVRTWARDNGIECPASGRVPTSVRDRYDAAHEHRAGSVAS